MKRTLILVRHGKSSWEEASLADRERPLAARGLRDAPRMGRRLARNKVLPDLILSSPACRARTTAMLMAAELDGKRDIVIDERLYGGDVRTLLGVVTGLGDELGCVMLVSHNPELSELAHLLSRAIREMPTCAIVRLTFDAASWAAIPALIPAAVHVDSPKRRRGEAPSADSA
ncbi:SixA phosphatase family protein [Aeromonas sp. QDB30]|uniref:SixA phosphatase family protein n=1 Tax=Aeromonas sp. QDB30 TaxID=2989831 RepID=UPI0022E46697|nr:histidine phosphatase family protein [Aeromonas sp. QDB30]